MESQEVKSRIMQRLAGLGVPQDFVDSQQAGLVEYVKENQVDREALITAIFPTDEDAEDCIHDGDLTLTALFEESMVWSQWLMFMGDPGAAITQLSQFNASERGVCGVVWENPDSAYRCKTCEEDSTRAICVTCFQNGDHKGHDYFITRIAGGCCDCGDVIGWKPSGFCLKHKGPEQIQTLPSEFANSIGPILDELFSLWRNRLIPLQSVSERSPPHIQEAGEKLTYVVVEMLLEFCKNSECLLSFISKKLFSVHGLMEILLRVEQHFIWTNIAQKLHELMFKLLGVPEFKYEFAKAFLGYYPTVIAEAIKVSSDEILEKYPLLRTFSVQIFTMPTLTPRVVKEMNFFLVHLECLEKIFLSCVGDDGRLKTLKWEGLYQTTIRVVEDIEFVMSHSAVPIYATREWQDIGRMWMRILSFVQGMYPQKRKTSMNAEEENENVRMPFVLGTILEMVHSYLLRGAFSDASSEEIENDSGSSRQELEDPDCKIGKISQECSISNLTGRNMIDYTSKAAETKCDHVSIPSYISWLTFECLRTIDSWLVLDDSLSRFSSLSSTFSRTLFKFSEVKLTSIGEVPGRQNSIISCHGISNLDSGQYLGEEARGSGSDDISTETECSTDLESLKFISSFEWPDIVYDVSLQNISLHIPLHRLLSMILQRSLRKCYGESAFLNVQAATSRGLLSTTLDDFFPNILGGCHPYRFSAFLMEHPLRIRVHFAQVRAGLWRSNGDFVTYPCEWYHSARWSGQFLDPDLFLLQCCAALAPPDLYVKRILERFDLSDYLYLNLERYSEYESVLVQEMLTLIIQIVKERRFCGLTTAESLRKELVYKLSVGDATHSQLVESVPPDLLKIGDLQPILDSIAVFFYPFDLNEGKYKLRLECWKELDLYHPRFNSRDLQIAEERYLRFCNISAVTAQLPCWSKIYQPLSGIARIATCKTILQIVRATLFYAVFVGESMASRTPESVLLTALHMLSLALNICSHQRASDQSLHNIVIPILELASEEISSSRGADHSDQSLLSLLVILMRLHKKKKNESFAEVVHANISSLCDKILKNFAELELKCFIKLQKIAPEVVNQLAECNSNLDGSTTGLASDSQKCKAIAQERQAAVLEKMKAEQSKFLESMESNVCQEADVSECDEDLVDNKVFHDSKDLEEVICSLCHYTNSKSPVCFLIHLQKSKLLSFIERGPILWEHSSLSKEDHFSPGKCAISTPSSNVSGSSHLKPVNLVHSAADRQPHEINAFLRNIDHPLIPEDVLVKASSIENLEEHIYSLVLENLHTKLLLKDFQKYGDDYSITGGTQERSSQSLLLGKYIASMALEMTNSPSGSENLYSRHNEAQSSDSIRTHAYDGFGPLDSDGVYLSSCGHAVHQVCLERYLSSLMNRYVERIPFEGRHIIDPDKGEFLCPVCRGLANSSLPIPPRVSEKVSRPTVFPNPTALDSASLSREVDSLQIQEAVCLMENAAFIAGNKESIKSINLQQFQIQKSTPDSLLHAICSMYFPGEGKLFESGMVSQSLLLWDLLKYLIASTEVAARSGKLLNEFILSPLLIIAQGSRTESIPSTLLRFRGIQLCVKSLSLRSSNVEQSCQEGNLFCLMETSDSEARCLDIQFWKRVSDPVLAHDSFSSLMWALFCLPTPFLSCKESFFRLLHIFYLVTITQAIIIWCRKRCSLTEWGSKNSLITDIWKVTRNHEILFQYIDSNYIDSCSDIKDAIRTVSCTFLRRCSLLWDLINSSASFPFSHGNQVTYGSLIHQSNILDIAEVKRLELMFNIPPIDMIINDGISRSMATRWLDHFTNEFKLQGRNILYCTPSVPFSLVVLPNLYEDLMHRYIKQHCPDCGAVLKELALCLLCGKLCAPNGLTCCRESCHTHAMACGAGIGVFLLIRKTSILLQRAARKAPWPSPYLDKFGEEDSNMRRGRPLYLNNERYAALTHMVASHGLDRSSRVLDQTTRE